jgi:hypothetical protein
VPELNVIPSRLPFAKSTANGPPFSMCGVPEIAANPYVQALEEPKRDPKRLWRTKLGDGPASRRKLGPKNFGRLPELNVIPTRSIMRGGPAIDIQEKAQYYSGSGLKCQTPARKSAQLSRAPARAAAPIKSLMHPCFITASR